MSIQDANAVAPIKPAIRIPMIAMTADNPIRVKALETFLEKYVITNTYI
jgi:hypothetical protein